VPEPYQSYPTGYVQALENHAAMLEHTLSENFPGTAIDHLEAARSRQDSTPTPTVNPAQTSPGQQLRRFSSISSTSPETERTRLWQQPAAQAFPEPLLMLTNQNQNHPSPPDFASLPAQSLSESPSIATSFRTQMTISRPDVMDEIPTATAASFMRTYFTCVHPQYPFLSVADCAAWYQEWKMAPPGNPISGWPAFFVKMVLMNFNQLAIAFADAPTTDLCHWFAHPVEIGQRAEISTPRPEVPSAKRRFDYTKYRLVVGGQATGHAALGYVCATLGIYPENSSYQRRHHEICDLARVPPTDRSRKRGEST
jgi:hypothetical protein